MFLCSDFCAFFDAPTLSNFQRTTPSSCVHFWSERNLFRLGLQAEKSIGISITKASYILSTRLSYLHDLLGVFSNEGQNSATILLSLSDVTSHSRKPERLFQINFDFPAGVACPVPEY